MNQIYFKMRYLFVLLSFLACSGGMAQSPFPNVKNTGAKMAISAPDAPKEQVSKKNDSNSNAGNNAVNLSVQEEKQQEEIKGIKLSEQESQAIKKQAQESQKIVVQKISDAEKTSAQDSVKTNVKSFAKSASLTAKNIFEVKKGDFDLSKSDKMQLKSISDNHGRTLATYQQMHNAVPIEGAIYKIRENKTKIDAFGTTAKKLPESSNYKISAAAGLEIALKTVNAKQYVWESKKLGTVLNKEISTKPQGELVYVGPNFSSQLTAYYLTWKYDIYAISPQSSQTIYVDANSGKVVLTIDLSHDSGLAAQSLGKGKSRYSGEVTFNTTQYPEGFKLEGSQGKYNVPMYTWNMNHAEEASDEVITEYIDQDNIWNELHNKDHDEVALDIHWGMQKTIEYYGEKFNRNSIDNKGMTIIGLAHLGTNVENASWTGGWAQFGDGINTPYTGLGITAHELTHGVTRFTAGLIYQGESGALNEAFSDIFGVSVEFYVGRESKDAIWLLGDELYSYGSMRNMGNPKAQGQPSTYGGVNWIAPTNLSYDNGGVHINSGVANYWYYLIAEGGQGVNDLNNSYDVKGIGLAKAEKIAYITLTEYLSPSSNFSDMRQATLMVAEDLYGLGSDEYKQITNAWYAVGVGVAYANKQISIVSIEKPTAACGTLKGNEPFYIKIKNTGSSVIKSDEGLNYKIRLMVPGFGGRLSTTYTNDAVVKLAKDLQSGEETVIKIQEQIPFRIGATVTNYVEVKFDFKPIAEFGAKDGISFVSTFVIPPGEKDFDLKVTGLNLPEYTGQILTANHPLAVSLYNLGCQDIPAGSALRVGYRNKLDGNEVIWKDITLETAFSKNSEMSIPLGSVDLSAAGLHAYEVFVEYSNDPVTTNNSAVNAVYNGIVNQFPYFQDFENTPGGWYSKSILTSQKFVWQQTPQISFRDTNSKYLWGTVKYGNNEKIPANADFTLQSPIFDFTNVVSPYVEFDMVYFFTRGADGLIIEYSEDNQNWKKVEDVKYNETVHYNDLVEGPWFTAVNNITDKKPMGMYLNDLAGKKAAIRFRVVTSDAVSSFMGAFIDNVRVDNATYDLEVITAKGDAGSCDINNDKLAINTTIVNNFSTTSEQVTVAVKILDSAQNEVFSKTEKASLVFTKFKDTINYSIPNINLKTIGRHTIVVSVFPEDMAQDQKPENNTITFTYDNWNNDDMKVTTLPYTMDFEGENKYKGWRSFQNKTSAGWIYGTSQELGSPGWFLEGHDHFMASNDDKCNCDASNDMLLSPVFDLSNYKEAHLTFDGFADGQRFSDGYVKVSTDGGKTWEQVFKASYITNWIEYRVDLTPYAGKPCVIIAFVHDDNGLFANGFAIDNIKIEEKQDFLQLSNLSIAATVYEDAPSHEFYISAKNLTYSTINKIIVEYQISQNGNAIGKPVVLERNTELFEYQTSAYKIDGIPQLPAGNYEIAVKVYTDGQPKDKITSLTGRFEVMAKALVLNTQTFSDVPLGALLGTKGFVSSQSDQNYPWSAITTPENTNLGIPKKDHTGDGAATMLYNPLEYSAVYGELISPMYHLAENAGALEFYYAMNSNYNNAFIVDIKTAGSDWKEEFRNSRSGAYADSEWLKGIINLSKYAGKSVMFRFRHAKAGGYSYMILDDLKITTDPIQDVSVTLLSPKDICGTSEVKVKLTNEGKVAIQKNAIELVVNYANTNETISEIIETEIPVGQSVEYAFKKQPKLNEKGISHVFNINAKLENDAVLQNNEIKEFVYQETASDFKIFDNPTIHGYTGKTLYVDAATNFSFNKLEVASYKWNTGESTNDIEINKAGDYTVTATLKNGCILTETLKVTFDTFESDLVSGDVCGPEVVLSPGDYQAYEWFDGSTDATYPATESGTYFVTVYNENGLGQTFSTTISILENNVVPEIRVAGDKKLTASIDAASYQWYLNDRPIPNATEKSIVAFWEGNYSLQVTNNNGCNNISAPFDSKGMLLGKITNAFRVFPNPAIDTVNIFLADKAEGETQIKIYAADGKEVWKKSYAAMPSSINVSALNSGMYVLDCQVQGKRYTAKIIKN
ncbi:M4 family metallopeptidase [Flavobacterium hungaricum]|uniref:T9SS C-terminal target domain-containing protein n=1 Tax=Flavobacterium hungaricum TaxID=2082725 RepID=A0ABR9TFG2_9FLAO|nr:M4 family metallopeptidase [Flavobacterium hungaricum]MBE8724085.1 T9SS C-terminal target domain-containing protein [Flavobacterium hungaricum]